MTETPSSSAPLEPPTGTLPVAPTPAQTPVSPAPAAATGTATDLSDQEYLASLPSRTVQVVKYGVPLDTTDDQLEEIAAAEAGMVAAAQQAVPTSVPSKQMDEVSVKVVRGQEEGWYPIRDVGEPGSPGFQSGVGSLYGEPDGRTVVWHVNVTDSPEAKPCTPITDANGVADVTDDGQLQIKVPELTRRFGGLVRAMHGLGGQVRIDALSAEGLPIGYLAAVTISDNEAEVKVAPGTDLLLVDRA